MFSGLPKNSLTLEEIKALVAGETVYKRVPNQFFKSLTNMNVSIKEKQIQVRFNPDKKLVGNKFIPHHIRDTNTNFAKIYARNFISKIGSFLKKFNKKENPKQKQT